MRRLFVGFMIFMLLSSTVLVHAEELCEEIECIGFSDDSILEDEGILGGINDYIPSESYKNGPYYSKLLSVNLTGNMRQDIVNIALSQEGYHEGDNINDLSGTNTSSKNNYTEYNKEYPGQAWCACFVSWCARRAGIPTSILTNGSTAGSFNSQAQNIYNPEDYSPENGNGAGDLVVMVTRNNDKSIKSWDHIGIICSYSNGNANIIWGNDGQYNNVRYTPNINLVSYGLVVICPKYSNSGKSDNDKNNISNPRKNTNGDTVWDCVYFGKYWQEDTNGDGKADTNDEKQPIKWRVLSVDKEKMLLLSDKNLDTKQYNEEKTVCTWKSCSLRKWLNGYGNFSNDNLIEKIFGYLEEEYLLGIEGDKITLLSDNDTKNATYGFNSDPSIDDPARRAKNTSYATQTRNARVDSDGYGLWILRYWGDKTQGTVMANVSNRGRSSGVYSSIITADRCIRPVILLKRTYPSINYAGTVCSDGTSNESSPSEEQEDNEDESVTIEPKEGFINKVVRTSSGKKYTVQFTSEVVYNSLKHVEYGRKASKNAVGDVVVRIYKPNGEKISQNVYKLKFRNNKNCFGLKEPYFKIVFDKGYNQDVVKAFKNQYFTFGIGQADFSNLSFHYKSISEKNKKVMVKGLYYINDSGKRIKLKQKNSSGKGDFETTKDSNGKVYITGINNYKGKVFLATIEKKQEEQSDDLLKIIEAYTKDERQSGPIVADFNGDGRDEMVCEFGREDTVNGIDMWMQYYVYTDGVNTYKFGETEEGHLYKTVTYLIPVDGGYHFATTSEWRSTVLGGHICSGGIYELGLSGAKEHFNKFFCKLTNPQEKKIDIIYYEEPVPGSVEDGMGTLYWNGNTYSEYLVKNGITSDYSNAKIKPSRRPETVWQGVSVKEITAMHGIHFYIPSYWCCYQPELTGI